MTTAREQAREAGRLRNGPPLAIYSERAADAASDVWEPLLRECYDLLFYAAGGEPVPGSTMHKIKEALG